MRSLCSPTRKVGVDGHAPEERGARNHFDKAVETEADQRDATGEDSSDECDDGLKAVPGKGEIFQTAASAHQKSAIGGGDHGAYVIRCPRKKSPVVS